MTRHQALLGATLFLATACRDSGPATPLGPALADPTAVIARFRGGEIRRGEIQSALVAQLASAPSPLSSEVRQAIVRKIVERRVRTTMLFDEALAK